MQKQRLIFVIVGVILGLVAVVMVNVYINDMAADAKRKGLDVEYTFVDYVPTVILGDRSEERRVGKEC